jgi:magnesium transporter
MAFPDVPDPLPSRLDTAAAHLATEVPVAAPGETAGTVRDRLPGHRWDSLTDVAVCEDGRLLGLVTIEVLMAAAASATMRDLMDDTPPVVGPGTDQEVAARTMVEQNESALAVVDEAGRFLGLVPPFALARVLLEEHEEDMARLGGFLHGAGAARSASEEPVSRRLWHRLPWLVLGLGGAMTSAVLLGGFEQRLSEQVVLAFFLPAIVYMADAVGTQTETLAVRGLSVGVPIHRVVGKELGTGLLIGALIALAFCGFSLLVWGDTRISVVVSLSLWASCSVATVVALLLPWLLARLNRDPAFGSGPLATVVQDLLSLVIYLSVATVVLG